MKKAKYSISPQAVCRLLKREWNIHTDVVRLRNVPLKEFGITVLEVNWLLNAIEWKYGVEIEEVDLSLQATLDELLQVILRARRKGVKSADASAYRLTSTTT